MSAQETFAKEIKDRLLAAGFSYKKFGDALGSIPHQTVSRWVNGRGLPEYGRLAPISKVLGIDYQRLYTLWVEAVSERSRKVAGEPLDSQPSTFHETAPTSNQEIEEIKRRMTQLENEIRKLNQKK